MFNVSSKTGTYRGEYSLDKKEILLKCFEEGKTIVECARIASIKENTSKSIVSKYKSNLDVLLTKMLGGIVLSV